MSVDKRFIESQTADIEGGTAHLLVEFELCAQIARTELAVDILDIPRHWLVETNPLSAPVALGEQTHVPGGDVAPCRLTLGGAHLHTPEAAGVAGQGLAGVGDPLRAVAGQGDIPQVALQFFGLFSRRGHDDVAGSLHHILLLRRDDPAQSWSRGVDAHGADHAFGFKLGDRYGKDGLLGRLLSCCLQVEAQGKCQGDERTSPV